MHALQLLAPQGTRVPMTQWSDSSLGCAPTLALSAPYIPMLIEESPLTQENMTCPFIALSFYFPMLVPPQTTSNPFFPLPLVLPLNIP